MKLWQNGEHPTEMHFYEAKDKKSDAAVIIFPGGGYHHRAEHEGKGYAEFLQNAGINSFVVDYRLNPELFPLPLLDARRAVRFIRMNAETFGINPQKIAVMGSSAGGHLAAMEATYKEKIDGEGVDEIDSVDFIPDAQILCYPVILSCENEFSHKGSYTKLLGEENLSFAPKINPAANVSKTTPQAFIWHTSEDGNVNVINSYEYAKALRINNVPAEMHIFPYGKHGLGILRAPDHVKQWTTLLLNWFKEIGWME